MTFTPTPKQELAAALAYTGETLDEWDRSPEAYKAIIRESMRSVLVAAAAAPVQVDEAELAEFLESPTHEPTDKHCAPDATCANCPVPVHELPPVDLARKVAEWLRGGAQ